MLVFVDEPKNLKLVRTSPEEGTRLSIGKINKSLAEITPDLAEKLEGEERTDLDQALELIRRTAQAKLQVEVGEFPATCRRMYEYYSTTADPLERRWILGAVLELLRLVRRDERRQAQGEA